MAEPADAAARSFDAELASAAGAPPVPAPGGAVQAIGDGHTEPDFSGVRFDLLAADAVGNPFRWRAVAEHNAIANPLSVAPGTVLSVPPLDGAA